MGGSIPVIQTAGANRVLTDQPRELFESGRYNKVPVMYIILNQLISSLKPLMFLYSGLGQIRMKDLFL